MAAITLVRLLSAVHPLVSVQVVTLNEPHITRVTSKWLLSCEQPEAGHLEEYIKTHGTFHWMQDTFKMN